MRRFFIILREQRSLWATKNISIKGAHGKGVNENRGFIIGTLGGEEWEDIKCS